MTLNQLLEWFKTSIPGIIILGALGSIFALLLLRLAKWLFYKFVFSLPMRVLRFVFRYYLIHKSLALRYLKLQDKSKLIVFSIWVFVSAAVSASMFLIVAGVTILYFTVIGAHLSFISLVLVALTFLSCMMWLRQTFAATGAWSALLKLDLESEKKKIQLKKAEEIIEIYLNLESEREASSSNNSFNPTAS